MTKLIFTRSKFKPESFDDDSRTMVAYAAHFDNIDDKKDITRKGAFARSIQDWGPTGKGRIKLVAQHDMKRPIGRIIDMEEDDKGLLIKAVFGTHTDGDDYYRMAKEGVLDELSVGYITLDSEPNGEGGRYLKTVKLYEISLLTHASNDEAVVLEVKQGGIMDLVKQVEDKDLAFQLEKEVLKLQDDGQTTTSAAEEDAPEQEEPVDEFEQMLDTILT